MNHKYIWNVKLPIKLFDTDIDKGTLLEYVNYDELFKELLSAKAMFIIERSTNQYSDWEVTLANYVGGINNIYAKDGNLYADVSMFINSTKGQIIKEVYDLLHTEDNSIYYLTPHGVKEKRQNSTYY